MSLIIIKFMKDTMLKRLLKSMQESFREMK